MEGTGIISGFKQKVIKNFRARPQNGLRPNK